MPHYADGRPAKVGDLAVRQQAWDRTETAMIITSINPAAESCNASAIPLATKQGEGPWFPEGPQAKWYVTLKETMKLDDPAFPPEQGK